MSAFFLNGNVPFNSYGIVKDLWELSGYKHLFPDGNNKYLELPTLKSYIPNP